MIVYVILGFWVKTLIVESSGFSSSSVFALHIICICSNNIYNFTASSTKDKTLRVDTNAKHK